MICEGGHSRRKPRRSVYLENLKQLGETFLYLRRHCQSAGEGTARGSR